MYEERRYTDTGFERHWRDAFKLTTADLTPIGRAAGATVQAGPYRDDAVYQIAGVEPMDAVAMIYASGGVAVLLGGAQPPDGLCPYFKRPLPVGVTCGS
jgi:hypothetical protein